VDWLSANNALERAGGHRAAPRSPWMVLAGAEEAPCLAAQLSR
jgi:hypothetical protein